MKNKKIYFILACTAVIAFSIFFIGKRVYAPKNNDLVKLSTSNSPGYSLDNPESTWVIVNKKRPLPLDYIPGDLATPNIFLNKSSGYENTKIRKLGIKDLESLFTDAENNGNNLELVSGYRSYTNQNDVYSGEVQSAGIEHADKISARAGHSEHQTGLAVDLGRTDKYCTLVECFGDTKEGKWIAENAYKYGFIVRYQKGKQSVVGYEYEPWHIRYVGKDLAKQLQRTGQTMEEFFGLPAASTY